MLIAHQNRFIIMFMLHTSTQRTKPPPVLIAYTKTHRPAGRCFQMPGGALGPGFPPRALPLPKNPEEYRKITKHTGKARKIPKKSPAAHFCEAFGPEPAGGGSSLPGGASETRAVIRKPTITTGGVAA